MHTQMIGGVVQAAAANASHDQRVALGPALSRAKTRVLKEVGAGALEPLDPLTSHEKDGEGDGGNARIRQSLAERLLAVVVEEESPSPEFGAWVRGLWAGLGVDK